MRIDLAGVLWVAFLMPSYGGMGSPPELEKVEAGSEPAEGGNAEVVNPSASMAKKSGKPLSQLQRGHAGLQKIDENAVLDYVAAVKTERGDR